MGVRRFAGASAAALVIGWMVVALAPAASASAKHYVSPAPVGSDTSCANPGFNSVQSAINASTPNATIVVCSGAYSEQLTIQESLKIVGSGSGSTSIGLPASPVDSTCNPSLPSQHSQDLVDVCGSGVKVTLSGITVTGPWPVLDCSIQPYGIAVVGGATLTTKNVTVTAIREDPLNGCQGGVGILVGRSATGQVGHSKLSKTTITDYQKLGIKVSNTGSNAKVTSSTVTGVGPTDQIAQNGVEVDDGAKATVSNSSISGNECDNAVCGPDPEANTQAAGILLIDSGTTSIKGSRINANDMGLYNFEDTSPAVPTVASDTFSNNRYAGVMLDQGDIKVTKARISGSNDGIVVLGYSGQTGSPGGTFTGGSISGASDAAILSVTDGSAGLPAPHLGASMMDLSSGNAYGVKNLASGVVVAEQDWWGDVNGAGDWNFGAGAGVSDNVDVFPWATNPAMSTFAACTMSGSTIIDNPGTPYAILCGTSGNDYVEEDGSGPALLLGFSGSDQLIGGPGSDFIVGSPGNDFINGNAGADSIQGRGGSDTCITGGDAGDRTSGC